MRHQSWFIPGSVSDDEFLLCGVLVFFSQYKLDEALLTSGRVSDACQSLMDWLQKAESTLADDMPVYGDLDTVLMLIEQHRVRELALNCATYILTVSLAFKCYFYEQLIAP